MNDEQLERDLRAALLQDDPGPMPARLSGRVVAVPDKAASRRGLDRVHFPRFSPMLRSLEAIAAVVVVAAIIVVALGLRHSSSPAAAGPSQSAVASATTEVTSTAVGTPGPTAKPAAQWASLTWSAPNTVSDSWGISAVVSWRGQYLAAGAEAHVAGSGAPIGVAFWSSKDGSTWSRLAVDASVFADSSILSLVATPSGLVAWGWDGQPVCTGEGEGQTCGPMPLMIWTSPDGSHWSRVADMSAFAGATIANIAYGPLGLVAVGDTGFDSPAIWISETGTSWFSTFFSPGDPLKDTYFIESGVFKDAHFTDIKATASGYVIAGSTGGTAPVAGGVQAPGTGVAAAWWYDGQTWNKAGVNRLLGSGTSLGTIHVGAGGMVAIGSATGGKIADVWVSSDGETWATPASPAQPAQNATSPTPSLKIYGDGTRLIALGSGEKGALRIWVSSDGLSWDELTLAGDATAIPGWEGSGPTVQSVYFVPDGLIVVGANGSGSAPPVVVWHVTAQL